VSSRDGGHLLEDIAADRLEENINPAATGGLENGLGPVRLAVVDRYVRADATGVCSSLAGAAVVITCTALGILAIWTAMLPTPTAAQ